MKSIKILISFTLVILCFASTPAQSISPEELQEYAIKANDSALIDILRKYGVSEGLLNRAMEAKDYFAVYMLVEYGVNINSRGRTDEKTEKYHLTGTSQTVLEMAIEADEVSLIEYFLQKKADPTNMRWLRKKYSPIKPIQKDDFGTSAVYDAIKGNRLDVLGLFLQYGVDLNKVCHEVKDSQENTHKQTPIQIAVTYAHRDIVALLLSVGADLY